MKHYKLSYLAEFVGGEIFGDDIVICGISTIDSAKEKELTFLANPKYKKKIFSTNASAIIVKEKIEGLDKSLIICENPYLAYAKIAHLFYNPPKIKREISPYAFLGEGVKLGKDVSIYPFVYIDDNAEIGDRVTIMPHVFIGQNVKIGEDSFIYPNVTIREDCVIGKRVIIHSGTVVGSDGFGYVWDGKRHMKIPQIGKVVIGDDVEIGALCAIDRSALSVTEIGSGVKMDNLCQIAHSVKIGENSIIVAQVGIAGSTTLGKNVILAGQVGVVGHIKIGDRTTVGAKSGVASDLPSGSTFSGIPAIPHKTWLKSSIIFSKLPEFRDRLMKMEKRLEDLEKRVGGDHD